VTPATPATDRQSPNRTKRREPVRFLCVHWTGGTFSSAVDWCCRDESDVSYHVIIGPDGAAVQLVPWDYAAWAVGWSKSPAPWLTFTSGNHASESIALAGGPATPPTAEQVATLVQLLTERMRARGWGAGDVRRILGHDDVAVYKPGHAKAGRFGRKPDPQGTDAWGKPEGGWLPLAPIRAAVAAALERTP